MRLILLCCRTAAAVSAALGLRCRISDLLLLMQRLLLLLHITLQLLLHVLLLLLLLPVLLKMLRVVHLCRWMKDIMITINVLLRVSAQLVLHFCTLRVDLPAALSCSRCSSSTSATSKITLTK